MGSNCEQAASELCSPVQGELLDGIGIRSGWFSNLNMSTQVALLLRDEDDLVKDRFIHNLKLPENFMYVRQVDIS